MRLARKSSSHAAILRLSRKVSLQGLAIRLWHVFRVVNWLVRYRCGPAFIVAKNRVHTSEAVLDANVADHGPLLAIKRREVM